MGARHKLNQAYLNGALLMATFFGAVAKSWLVFFAILGVLASLNLYSGEIRLDGRQRK